MIDYMYKHTFFTTSFIKIICYTLFAIAATELFLNFSFYFHNFNGSFKHSNLYKQAKTTDDCELQGTNYGKISTCPTRNSMVNMDCVTYFKIPTYLILQSTLVIQDN